MYPFDSRFSWHANTGYMHLVEAIEGHTDRFADPYQQVLERRADQVRVALSVRGVVLVALNVGLVATAIAWIATVLPGFTEIGSLLSRLAGALTGVSLLLTGVFLLITRYLGQLQADIVSAMALGTGELGGQPEADPGDDPE